MRVVRLLVAMGAVVGLKGRPCAAQATASAAIKANVHPEHPSKGPKALVSPSAQLVVLGNGARGQLKIREGETMALALEGVTASRVTVLESNRDGETIECRAPMHADVRMHSPQLPLACDELLIRWADTSDLPERLSISSRFAEDTAHPGRLVA